MTRLLFFFLPIFLLTLSLLFAISVAAQSSTPECPLDPLACSHPCVCSGKNYGSCESKGMICGSTRDEGGPWKCIEGTRYVSLVSLHVWSRDTESLGKVDRRVIRLVGARVDLGTGIEGEGFHQGLQEVGVGEEAGEEAGD